MTIRGLAAWAMVGLTLLLGACGPGSGRYTGTDIVVTGVGPAGTVLGGESAAFVMTVTNAGPYVANDVSIANLIGNQLSLNAIVCTASGGATCPAPTSVTMSVPTLPVGGALTFEIQVTAAQGANGIVSNTLSATFNDDFARENNSLTITLTVASNNVGVSASAPSGPIAGGATTAFSMLVANDGPAAASNVILATSTSANLTLAGAIDCVPAGGAAVPLTLPDGTLSSAEMPAGSTLACSVPVSVAAGTNGLVSVTMSVSAAGDARINDNSATASAAAVSADLGVSQTGPAQVGAGSPAVFTAIVANPGPGTASNLSIVWTHNDAPGLSFDAPSCTPTGGASCPATLGPVMTLPSLAAGRSLVFKFTANTALNLRGAVVNTVAVSSTEDPDSANNTVTTATQVVDPRNGSYAAYGADGRPYVMAIDFDAGSYTLTGGGLSLARNFALDAASGDYVVAGAVRFRVGTDVIVGGEDFGAGVLPYVAARSFVTSVASIAGPYNLATRNLPAAGTATTHAGTALVSGNTLTVCQSDLAVTAVLNCDPAARKDYVLGVAGNVFTGIATSGERFSFSVAASGAARILLSAAPAPDTSAQLRIGLPDSTAGLTGGNLRGPSSSGDWLAIALTATSYAATSASGSDSAALARIRAGSGPFSMLTGTLASDAARIYVLQTSPLAVVVGGFGGSPSASGLLQLALP